MASCSTKLTLKLLIDSKREKVLFAEASKAVVDFLFNLLCLPLGTVIRLLSKNGMVGCLGNLYESVEKLDQSYMQPNQHKHVLLKPRAPISSSQISGLLPVNYYHPDDYSQTKFYKCSSTTHNGYVTCDKQTPCPHNNCYYTMSSEMLFVGHKPVEGVFPNESGFVKEVVTYMVMDDLVIQPMSSISTITLLHKFNVTEIHALQEKVVQLEMSQGVNLLKTSLQSKTVLTDVFLKNNKG